MLYAVDEHVEADDEEIHNSLYAEQEEAEKREKKRQKALKKIKKIKEKPVSSDEVVDIIKAGKNMFALKKTANKDLTKEQRE